MSSSVVVILILIATATTSPIDDKPNILVILADDLGWGNVDWHNTENPEVKTPHLNELRKDGLELNRHYVHYVCCPTRSSFQSGRLPVHVNIGGCTASDIHAGVPQNMTTIAHKMKQANYSTHMIGKWHIGMATPTHSPKGRGFDTSLIYWTAEVDYYNQSVTCSTKNNSMYDGVSVTSLWHNGHPANTLNNTDYVDFLFVNEINEIISNISNSKSNSKSNILNPFFMVWTPHIVHAPEQVPKEYYHVYDNDENMCGQDDAYIYPGFDNGTLFHCRSLYESMVTLLDELIGNVTANLKANNLWNNTLIVFSSDNGGPLSLGCCSGNNYPLKGGKHTVWEGGVRAAAFVSGGYLPEHRRGQFENGMISIADWYTTFCEMLGIDPFDELAQKHNLPPVEGFNMWPLIIASNETSPRTQLPIDTTTLIEGDYKFIIGKKISDAGWASPVFPNSSTPDSPMGSMDCKNGCLFDVVNDIGEYDNLAKKDPNKLQRMNNTLNILVNGFFNNNDTIPTDCPKNVKNNDCPCWMAFNKYGGFWGPYCNVKV